MQRTAAVGVHRLALVAAVGTLVAGAPAAESASDTPPGHAAAAPPGAATESDPARWRGAAGPGPDSHLMLRLPPAATGPASSPAARRPTERPDPPGGEAAVPDHLALRLLDPFPGPAPGLTTPVSGPSAADAEPPAGPAAARDATDAADVARPGPDRTDAETRPAPAAVPEVPSDGSGHGAGTAVPPGSDPIKMVTIPLGQSRRWSLDHQATAVFAATPEIADVRLLSPDLLYVIGRGVGRTSVAVLDEQGLLDEWLVSTVHDLEPVRALLASDPALGGVRAQHFSRGVTLTGEVESVAVAERAHRLAAAALPEDTILANEIDVRAPQQVNLEVQIAEVQRSVTESLGISWEAFNQIGRDGQLLWRVGRPLLAVEVPSAIDELSNLSPEFIEGQPTSSIGGRYRGARGAVQGVVDALANAGLANVLARPNLTAISGETASFFSGGEYPLPVGFRDGVIVFEYKKYGVLLDFVPTVVDPDRITLTVRPEVSERSDVESLVTVGTEIPVLNVRRAETTVELGNGDSIVIAGLFRSGSNTVESGLPGLKDLPVLGRLFRQDRIEANETELIVVVTANLVRSGGTRADAGAEPSPVMGRLHGYHF